MDFLPSEEQRALGRVVSDVTSAADVGQIVRDWTNGDAASLRQIWRALGDIGLFGLTLPESMGGSGATAVEVAIAFEALGGSGLPGPLIESAVVVPRLLAQVEGAPSLDLVVTGRSIATLAVPPLVPMALDADKADLVFAELSPR